MAPAGPCAYCSLRARPLGDGGCGLHLSGLVLPEGRGAMATLERKEEDFGCVTNGGESSCGLKNKVEQLTACCVVFFEMSGDFNSFV